MGTCICRRIGAPVRLWDTKHRLSSRQARFCRFCGKFGDFRFAQKYIDDLSGRPHSIVPDHSRPLDAKLPRQGRATCDASRPCSLLAQFLRDEEPFDSLANIGTWFAGMGYKGVQVPAWDRRVIDLDQAAVSRSYCDDYRGRLADLGLEVTSWPATCRARCWRCIRPTPRDSLDFILRVWMARRGLNGGRRAEEVHPRLRQPGLRNIPVLSGGFAWHLAYPWPQRPAGLIDEAFRELARRWRPLLDLAQEHGCIFGYELHPGSDLFDGATFELFLEHTANHPAACINYDPSHFLLQQLDYLAFIELYGKRISGFHVKDAEFRPSGRVGVYGGYQSWARRAGRFRSLGDGQVDFKRVFTLLTEAGFDGWPSGVGVLRQESGAGACEGAPFIARHIIESTEVAFDDFAGGKADAASNRKILG